VPKEKEIKNLKPSRLLTTEKKKKNSRLWLRTTPEIFFLVSLAHGYNLLLKPFEAYRFYGRAMVS